MITKSNKYKYIFIFLKIITRLNAVFGWGNLTGQIIFLLLTLKFLRTSTFSHERPSRQRHFLSSGLFLISLGFSYSYSISIFGFGFCLFSFSYWFLGFSVWFCCSLWRVNTLFHLCRTFRVTLCCYLRLRTIALRIALVLWVTKSHHILRDF